MTDIQPTLKAIDEAIDDYVTWNGCSRDAMVWSADEPEKPEPVAIRPWTEEDVAQARERAREGFARFAEAMHSFAAAIQPAFEAFGKALTEAWVTLEPFVEARNARRKHLHRAYRSRLLSRRRRAR